MGVAVLQRHSLFVQMLQKSRGMGVRLPEQLWPEDSHLHWADSQAKRGAFVYSRLLYRL